MDTKYIPYPEDPRIGVSKDGTIFNFKTCKTLKQHLLKSGYYNVVITSPGHKAKAYRVHRVIMATLNPIDDMCNLFINHIDGVKTNNNLSNLEWVTPKYNVDHAIDSMLWTTLVKIQIRNNFTGVVTTVDGLRRVARIYNVNAATLEKHLKSEYAGGFDYGGYSFRIHSSDEWPNMVSRKRSSHPTKCINRENNTLQIFESLAEAARVCGLPYRRMYHELITNCSDKYIDGNWVVTM